MAFHELLLSTYHTTLHQLPTSVHLATWLRNERHINFARIANSRCLETPGDSIFRTLDCSNSMISSFLSFRLNIGTCPNQPFHLSIRPVIASLEILRLTVIDLHASSSEMAIFIYGRIDCARAKSSCDTYRLLSLRRHITTYD